MKDFFWHNGLPDGCSTPVTKRFLCVQPLSPGSSGAREQFNIFLNFEKANEKNKTCNLPDLFSYLEKAEKELLQPI